MGNNRKVVKFHSVPTVNIGVIIFGLMFIFVTVQVIRGFNKKSFSVYEIQNSYMDTNITGSAIILREETLVNTDSSGYINYYIRNGQKVAKNATVYTIDPTGTLTDMIADSSDDGLTLNTAGYTEIKSGMSAFQNYFSDVNFSDVYEFKYDLESQVLDIASTQVLDELTAAGGSASGFTQIPSAQSGIITFYQDGYESKKPTDITKDDFNLDNYTATHLKTGEIIQAGSPVYKLITSEYWNLVLPLSVEDAERLKNDTRVTMYLPNIPHEVYGDIEVIQNGEDYFANITLDKLMVNYCDERFVQIEIVMTKQEGLNIPNSSMIDKQVLKIPIGYLTSGSNSTYNIYFNVRTLDEEGNLSVTQVAPDIYYKDDSFCYVDPNDFEASAVLVKNNSDETMAITDMGRTNLAGVYNVNQGIAKFQRIEILASDGEFTIISQDVPYSCALYDRIILDATTVEEDQIIH